MVDLFYRFHGSTLSVTETVGYWLSSLSLTILLFPLWIFSPSVVLTLFIIPGEVVLAVQDAEIITSSGLDCGLYLH